MPKFTYRETPIIDAEQITESSYDGFVKVCAHSLDCLIFIDDRRIEKEFENSDYRCDYEDDGHCTKKGKCECIRKIGYIKTDDGWHYPMVGDYKISGKTTKFIKKEDFEKTFKKLD